MNNNPLKQYFRRPAIYIKLPSNYEFYNSSIIDIPPNGEIPVYPMTAIDEITSRTPDAVLNGHAVADIIKSCLPCIKDPWQINSIDMETILIAIRVASNGDTMTIGSKCPSCKNETDYNVNLVSILSSQQKIDYSELLSIHELKIKFKPLTYKQTNENSLLQYEVQKSLFAINDMEESEEKVSYQKEALKKLNDAMNTMIASTIDYIQTPETSVSEFEYILEFLANCDKQTSSLIKNQSISLKNKNDIPPLKLKCINCSHEYNQPLILNVTDFFV